MLGVNSMLFFLRRTQCVGIIIGFIYAYGVVLGAFPFLISWATGKLSVLPWWEYALAPFALGIVAIAIEWALAPIAKRSSNWHRSIPQWKKGLFLLFVVFLMFLYIFWNAIWPCSSC